MRLVGRLTLREFDSLELVDVLGGIVSAHELAERVGVSVDAAYQRLWRLEGVGLLRSWREPNIDNPRAARAYFAPTDDGWALYREAWAAIDAACEEAAA